MKFHSSAAARCLHLTLPLGLLGAASMLASALEERFQGGLQPGWKWLRENKQGWKLTSAGLQVAVEPGNMWGPGNDAKNVLLFPVPAALQQAAEVTAEISHQPKKRWEQADLVWYYSDSTMVKIGLEIENDRMNVVMGREENDKTKTIAIVPFDGAAAELRLVVKNQEITGSFRVPGAAEWKEAGKTTLPAAPPESPPCVSLQFYQGEEKSGRFAVVKSVSVKALPAK